MPALQNDSERTKITLHVSRPACQCVEMTAVQASTKCFFAPVSFQNILFMLQSRTKSQTLVCGCMWRWHKACLSFMPQVPWSRPTSAAVPRESSPPMTCLPVSIEAVLTTQDCRHSECTGNVQFPGAMWNLPRRLLASHWLTGFRAAYSH